MRRVAAHVLHQPFELVFGAVRGEVGNLRLEGTHQVRRGVHDGGAEVVDAVRVAAHALREARGFGVQADAEHGVVARGGVAQHVEKGHPAILGLHTAAASG